MHLKFLTLNVHGSEACGYATPYCGENKQGGVSLN